MSLWAIVPVKPLYRAKSRLADILSPEQRYAFAEAMYRQVLSVVTGSPLINGTLVISRDTKALAIARDMGAKTVQESSSSALNPALLRATEIVRLWGTSGILILPADLPFVSHIDVAEMVKLAGGANPCMVIATDHEENGTNAMLLNPPGLIEYMYGEGSYRLHIEAAKRVGATVKVYDSQRLKLDIDVPEDLFKYNALVQTGNFHTLPIFFTDNSN